ncbi:glycosyltransferase [Virgibacillus halodenitrificans]|uniref:glycosyltransferase n=1 Tax=Virgibacillus halodenitrificans TaxID=1482 RepID=UPI001FB542D1|nr:glycosyltransferase [Virgibacillus halodenitrificans]MCJ0929630.1 glycosyltransferase [Virgibacillus halodenitrificans]WHX26083.1 glycosyltransferase [Virgibacillus halodenitrificans]
MNLKDKVSIIVPVYNAEKKLEDCLDSILQQSYQELEIILVNDGSTDESGKICDSYATAYKHIQVIHQPNSGPSAARNRGIHAATGKYVQFVDADDKVHHVMTEKLVTAATGDLVICGYQSLSPYGQTEYLPSLTGNYTFEKFQQHIGLLFKEIILPSPCNKLYRLENMRKHNITFNEGFTMGEDLLFNLDYIGTCSTIDILPEGLYKYCIHQEHSLTSSYQANFWQQQKHLLEQVSLFLEKHQCNDGANYYYMEQISLQSMINSLDHLFHNQNHLNPMEKIKEMKSLLREIVLDQNLYYKASLQDQLVRMLVRKQRILSLYLLFQVKNKLRHTPLFFQLKKLLRDV